MKPPMSRCPACDRRFSDCTCAEEEAALQRLIELALTGRLKGVRLA
jgi:hypothetical protein